MRFKQSLIKLKSCLFTVSAIDRWKLSERSFTRTSRATQVFCFSQTTLEVNTVYVSSVTLLLLNIFWGNYNMFDSGDTVDKVFLNINVWCRLVFIFTLPGDK